MLQASNLAMSDYHNILNAIFDGTPPVAGHVSFDIAWSGHRPATTVHDSTFGFSGTFIGGNARATFSAVDDANPSVIYRSDPNRQTSLAPADGRERNGAFFA